MEKYLVRVVRPVFETAYLEVEARSERDAEGKCYHSLYQLPEDKWSGRYNPDEHALDLCCLPTLETKDGYPFTLLDYPQYTILSTDSYPYMHAEGMEGWMREVVHPVLLANRFWGWIDEMTELRDGYYQKAIDLCEGLLRQWRGADQKIVSLHPPEDRRDDIELVETTLACLRLLKEKD